MAASNNNRRIQRQNAHLDNGGGNTPGNVDEQFAKEFGGKYVNDEILSQNAADEAAIISGIITRTAKESEQFVGMVFNYSVAELFEKEGSAVVSTRCSVEDAETYAGLAGVNYQYEGNEAIITMTAKTAAAHGAEIFLS